MDLTGRHVARILLNFFYEERGSVGTVDRVPEFYLQCTVQGTCFYSKPGFEALSFQVR